MKTVRLENNVVAEIVPDYALPVEKWYGAEFAARCVEAPDEVEQRWIYENGVFSAPAEPEAAPGPTIESVRAGKESEISAACNAAIVAGMDVETSAGVEHFSLEETDQINLTTATNAVQSGAVAYPYHADGRLCRMFTTKEILAVAQASINHKLYHTTLCNHLLTWVRRAETVGEIEGIKYSADELPEDLASNMAQILTAAASV